MRTRLNVNHVFCDTTAIDASHWTMITRNTISIICLVNLAGLAIADDQEFQRYDGWYNNGHHPDYGAAKTTLIHHTGVGYADHVHELHNWHRPSPGLVSDQILRGPDGIATQSNLTALFAFFGQLVSAEIVSTSSSGEIACPAERSILEVGHFGKCTWINNQSEVCVNKSTRNTLFFRAVYDQETGNYVNQPRKQINFVSSWIDGSSVYGPSQFWADQLRTFENGTIRLFADDDSDNDGVRHLVGKLHKQQTPHLGHSNRRGAEDLPLLALITLFRRYHNSLAALIQSEKPDWTDEQLFQRSRRLVIATLQNIIFYEYLPVLLGRNLLLYKGYRSYVDPSITAEFQTAFRVGHSFIPSGFFIRRRSANSPACDSESFRTFPLCLNSISRQNATYINLEGIVLGLASQKMERSDHIFSDAIQNRLSAPVNYPITQSDLVALDIMRERDFGLPDYNTVRSAYNLQSKRTFEEINEKLSTNNPELFTRLKGMYKHRLHELDLYVGGLLETDETSSLIGETFQRIIADQFSRLRDGDRFWFENRANGLLGDEDVAMIRSTTLYDVIIQASDIGENEIQPAVFFDSDVPCEQPFQINATIIGVGAICGGPESEDYFSGSEACFISSICALLAIPLICCLVAFGLARFKKKKTAPNNTRARVDRRISLKRMVSNHIADAFRADELTDYKTTRKIQIVLDLSNRQLRTYTRDAKLIRTIDFATLPVKIMLRLSSDVEKNCALVIHIPKEYDLVLSFETLETRLAFLESFRMFLQSGLLKRHALEVHVPMDAVLDYATTLGQRKRLLQSFFHTAFDQVLHAKTGNQGPASSSSNRNAANGTTPYRIRKTTPKALLPRFSGSIRLSNQSPSTKAKWRCILLTTELNKQEFAEAFQLKPNSLFVKQMFILADKDQNGYISYPEFIDILALLSEGTLETKMRMLFDMYDLDGSGGLDRGELTVMFRSLLDIAGDRLSDSQVEQVIQGMITQSNLECNELLSFDDFLTLIQQHQSQLADELNNRGFGFTQCEQDMKKRKRGGGDSPSPVIEKKEQNSGFFQYWDCWTYYLENNWSKVFLFVATVCISVCLFSYKASEYYFYMEHTGSRQITGFGVCLSRGASISISFCFAMIIVAVTRNLMTLLRTTWLARILPFDEAITFHRFVAYLALFYTTLHVIGHGINFYEMSTQPPVILKCAFPSIYFPDHFKPSFTYWLYETVPGVTGVLLVIFLSIIYVFANGIARHHIYTAFYFTHRLFIPVYILTFIHGSTNFLQEPVFYLFVTGPICLYVMDWMLSLQSQMIPAKVLHAEALPSDVLHLRFKPPSNSRFTYHSGQYIRIACSEISDRAFHPFTITTAPHEKYMSVHIRAVGPWTRRMLGLFKEAEGNGTAGAAKRYPTINLDGPYGSSHQDWYKFEVVVLVGAGIGVTPHASVLKDLVHKVYHAHSDITCRQVYFAWVARTHTQFEWFIDILRDVEKEDEQNLARTDIFVTQLMKDFDLRTMMLYICEHQFQRISNASLFTGLRAKTHFGRPNFNQYLFSIKRRHAEAAKIGVFTCGPKTIVRSVESACSQLNQLYPEGPRIIAHHEIF